MPSMPEPAAETSPVLVLSTPQNVDVLGVVRNITEPRQVTTRFRQRSLATVTVVDGSVRAGFAELAEQPLAHLEFPIFWPQIDIGSNEEQALRNCHA